MGGLNHLPDGYAARLELAVLMAWLSKDFAWVLLIPALAWPLALVAICLESHSVLLEWKTDSAAVRVHGVASLLWIVGNAVWMSSELLWDSSSCYAKGKKHSIFPWHSGPLLGQSEDLYWSGVMKARAVFVVALLMLVGYYVVSAYSIVKSRRQHTEAVASSESEPLVWGLVSPKVYGMIFIGPWILKDAFWTLSMFVPALICSVFVFALAMDAYRRFGATSSAVEITWVLGNTVWIVTELGYQTPMLAPRLVAACFLLIGVVMARQAYVKTSLQPAVSESSALIAGRAS